MEHGPATASQVGAALAEGSGEGAEASGRSSAPGGTRTTRSGHAGGHEILHQRLAGRDPRSRPGDRGPGPGTPGSACAADRLPIPPGGWWTSATPGWRRARAIARGPHRRRRCCRRPRRPAQRLATHAQAGHGRQGEASVGVGDEGERGPVLGGGFGQPEVVDVASGDPLRVAQREQRDAHVGGATRSAAPPPRPPPGSRRTRPGSPTPARRGRRARRPALRRRARAPSGRTPRR